LGCGELALANLSSFSPFTPYASPLVDPFFSAPLLSVIFCCLLLGTRSVLFLYFLSDFLNCLKFSVFFPSCYAGLTSPPRLLCLTRAILLGLPEEFPVFLQSSIVVRHFSAVIFFHVIYPFFRPRPEFCLGVQIV